MVNYGTEALKRPCPYCGELIELVVDLSIDEQEYVEDCAVCCRPMVVRVSVAGDEITLTLASEDQA